MRQKELTKEQKELCEKLNGLFAEAKEKNIGLIFDCADWSLTAFNRENVEDTFTNGESLDYEEDGIVEIDWDLTYLFGQADIERLNSDFGEFGLRFK